LQVESTEDWRLQTSNMLWTGPGLPLTFQAQRGWFVSGPPGFTDDQARTATPLDGRQIAQIGSSHYLDGRLICTELPVEQHPESPSVKIVRAVYTIPPASLDDTDPLRAPPIIRKHLCSVSLPADCDIHNNAIVNSAYDPPVDSKQRSVSILQLSIQLNVPLFLIAKGIQYTDTVNSDRFELLGAGFVNPLQCHCVGFNSINGSRQGQTYETVNVELEFADTLTVNGVAVSFFDLRFLDTGYNAYGTDGKKYRIKQRGDAKVVPMDVALDGLGKPMLASDYGLGESGELPIAAAPQGTPKGATVQKAVQGTFLSYETKQRRTFAGLL
jgi:hypothetical protein